jgi:succinoglycan biosynthesis protein ExoO
MSDGTAGNVFAFANAPRSPANAQCTWSTSMPKVSVIMPAYNATKMIARSIDSALHQTMNDLEVIVADDRSSDGTADFVRDRYRADARVRVIEMEKNGGPSAARNAAMAVARGEWLAILDADDAWRPERTETFLLEQDCDLLADQLTGYDAVAQTETGPFLRRSFSGKADLVRILRPPRGFDLGFLKPFVRRDFIERHAIRYPENMRHGEDYMFLIRILVRGGRFRVLPYAGYVYTSPRGRKSNTASPHSHTRSNQYAIAAALESAASEFAPLLSEPEKAAFASRAASYRSRAPYESFVAACRRRDAAEAVTTFMSSPFDVSRHLSQELWVRATG